MFKLTNIKISDCHGLCE